MVRSMLSGVAAGGDLANPAEENWRRSRGGARNHDRHPAIRNLIREDKVAQIPAIQTGGSLGMQTLDSCLKTWFPGIVSREAAQEPRQRFPENF